MMQTNMSNKNFQKDIPQLEGSNDEAKRKALVWWNILGMKEKRKQKKTGREKN